MAAFGASVNGANAAGDVTSLDTASLNVTGSDLALVIAAAESVNATTTWTFTWDPTGNNESMTGEFNSLAGGSFVGGAMGYLDDPTAANAVCRAAFAATADVAVVGAFFTAAGNIVGTDTASNSFATTGTSLSATPGNVATGDMVVDFLALGNQTALTVGANQTAQESNVDSGAYLRCALSTQAGADGGVMSWTFGSVNYGAILIAGRIPNAAGGALTASGTPSASVITASGTAGIASSVVITDVNTTESWTDGDTGLVITGTGFV